MAIFDGVLIISDIDGTLFTDECNLSLENLSAIKYFTDNGGKFTLASGRTVLDVSKIGEKFCNAKMFIGSNGAAIGNGKNNIYADYFTAEEINTLKLLLTQSYSSVEFLTDNGFYVYNANKFTNIHKSLVSDNFTFLNIGDQPPKKIYMTTCWMEEENLSRFNNYCKTLGIYKNFTCTKGYKYTCEVVRKTAGKGNAVIKLKEMLGAKTLITLGDSENDLSMVKCSDISFAPANAEDVVKQNASYCLSRTVERSIMPEVIEKLNALI